MLRFLVTARLEVQNSIEDGRYQFIVSVKGLDFKLVRVVEAGRAILPRKKHVLVVRAHEGLLGFLAEQVVMGGPGTEDICVVEVVRPKLELVGRVAVQRAVE